MSLPARWVLVEMFCQGERVKGAKAAGAAEFVVWRRPLTELRGCSSSSITRAKSELIERGLLIEQAGARLVNGVPRSNWMVPVVLDVMELATRLGFTEHISISRDATEHVSISRDAQGSPDSEMVAEHISISRDAPNTPHNPSRVRARPTSSSSSAIGGVVVVKHVPDPGIMPVESDQRDRPNTSGLPEPVSSAGESHEVALAGLRAAKVRHPESVLVNGECSLNSILGALREWVSASEAHERDARHPAVTSPSGFVMSRAKLEYEPVTDLWFARWWDPEGTPEPVISLALRRGAR